MAGPVRSLKTFRSVWFFATVVTITIGVMMDGALCTSWVGWDGSKLCGVGKSIAACGIHACINPK